MSNVHIKATIEHTTEPAWEPGFGHQHAFQVEKAVTIYSVQMRSRSKAAFIESLRAFADKLEAE